MEILGIIPARGGSKAIPDKNIAALNGKPLLGYTCESALASRRLSRVILSTDSHKIKEIGAKYGVETPFIRPPELAADDTPMLDVLMHALVTLADKENYGPEVIVLLQPTSPFRRAEHIDGVVDQLVNNQADSAVSVIEVPHQFNPVSVMELNNGQLRPFKNGPAILRRQDKPRVYARNGPAVLAVRYETIMKQGLLYGAKTVPFIMNHADSLDIDTPFEFLLAEVILRSRE